MGDWDYLGTVGTCPRCRRCWMLKLLGIPQTDHPLYLLPMPIHPANGGFFWYLRLSLFQSTGVNERMTLNLLEKIVAEGAVWCSCSVRGQWVMSAWAMHLLSYIVFCVFGLKIIVIPYLVLTVSIWPPVRAAIPIPRDCIQSFSQRYSRLSVDTKELLVLQKRQVISLVGFTESPKMGDYTEPNKKVEVGRMFISWKCTPPFVHLGVLILYELDCLNDEVIVRKKETVQESCPLKASSMKECMLAGSPR